MKVRIILSVLLTIAWVGSANAQVVRSITGTSQFAIGNGLPIPALGALGIDPTPNAQVTLPGASVSAVNITGPTITLPVSQFTHNPGATMGYNTPVFMYNVAVLQVYTNLSIQFPRNPLVLVPNGRTGTTASTMLTWCPGQTGALPTNPSCAGPAQGGLVSIYTCGGAFGCPGPNKGPATVNGLARYTRTGALLGGPGNGKLGGTFNVALNGGVVGSMGQATLVGGNPNSTAGHGQPFGGYNQNAPGVQPLLTNITITPNGAITMVGGTMVGAANNDTSWSFGVPFTAGTLYLKVTMTVAGGSETFTLVGYDNRNTMTGAGTIQLVGGSFGRRKTSGNNANRGTLNMTVPEPAAIAGAAGALLMLFGCHRAMRRRKN